MFSWMRKKHLEKITTSGGYPEKLAAIQAKERVADMILKDSTPVPNERRWRQEVISFADRRQIEINVFRNSFVE